MLLTTNSSISAMCSISGTIVTISSSSTLILAYTNTYPSTILTNYFSKETHLSMRRARTHNNLYR
jgi:hypothetical protein